MRTILAAIVALALTGAGYAQPPEGPDTARANGNVSARLSSGSAVGATDQIVCREPKSARCNGENYCKYGDNGFTIMMKSFADMPEPDKRRVISGAIFVAGIAACMAYLIVARK